MKCLRIRAAFLVALAACLWATPSFGDLFINELVEDEQDFETTEIDPDTRDFVELYNSANTPVSIENWTLGVVNIATGLPYATFTLPAGATIPANGYYVIGNSGVPNVNHTPDTGGADMFPNTNQLYELRNTSNTLVDALAVETFRGPVNGMELQNVTQEQLDQIGKPGQIAGTLGVTGGWWGQLESNNSAPVGQPSQANYPNLPLSLGRYKDGVDRNRNGYDFGEIPATPGTSNNRPFEAAHTVPNVDAVAVGTVLRTDYNASFKLPMVVDPTVVGPSFNGINVNPKAITASPQGGRAIIAWDETGGGNAAFSTKVTNKFAIYAYLDTTQWTGVANNSTYNEATTYGIGTTDPLFATPNSSGLLTGNPPGTLGQPGVLDTTGTGNTGFGWLFHKRTVNNAGTISHGAILQLVDFNDGGESVQSTGLVDWTVVKTYDLSAVAAGWHKLIIDYTPATGDVIGTYDSDSTTFNTLQNLDGTFYIGYREGLPGAGGINARPPTFDLFMAGLLGDFNNDTKVDAGDYATWRKNETANAALPNDNGLATQSARFALWRANFGNPPGSGSGLLDGSAVPEPSAMMLAAIGILFVAARRRR